MPYCCGAQFHVAAVPGTIIWSTCCRKTCSLCQQQKCQLENANQGIIVIKSLKNDNKINFAIKQTDRGLKTETNWAQHHHFHCHTCDLASAILIHCYSSSHSLENMVPTEVGEENKVTSSSVAGAAGLCRGTSLPGWLLATACCLCPVGRAGRGLAAERRAVGGTHSGEGTCKAEQSYRQLDCFFKEVNNTKEAWRNTCQQDHSKSGRCSRTPKWPPSQTSHPISRSAHSCSCREVMGRGEPRAASCSLASLPCQLPAPTVTPTLRWTFLLLRIQRAPLQTALHAQLPQHQADTGGRQTMLPAATASLPRGQHGAGGSQLQTPVPPWKCVGGPTHSRWMTQRSL